MKVVFLGTSDRSLPILETLHNNFELAFCVTRADAKVGRKQELKETYVKTWCKKNKIDFVEVENLKSPNLEKVIERINICQADVAVVADFSFMIPEEIISSFQHGMINIHFSLLPTYRGASPVQSAILNSDDKTGVTFYKMDKGMDTGAILKQFEYNLTHKETSGELYETLFKLAGDALPMVMNDYISGNLQPFAQDESKATYSYSPSHPKNTFIYKSDAKIDWSKDIKHLEAFIRAYNPWPIAWTTLGDLCDYFKLQKKDGFDSELIVKIHKASIVEDKLVIEYMQPQNSRKMTWSDFLNGYIKR